MARRARDLGTLARCAALGWAALLTAPSGLAQQPGVDSAAVRDGYFGTGTTYGEIVREYGVLRRLPEPEDTTSADSPDAGIQRLEIDGLVVDETLTRLGIDFYDVFFRLWSPPEGAINFTITIQEQPAPGTGTIVSVEVDDELVFQSRLQPGAEGIEEAARRAVYLTRQRLARREPQTIY